MSCYQGIRKTKDSHMMENILEMTFQFVSVCKITICAENVLGMLTVECLNDMMSPSTPLTSK